MNILYNMDPNNELYQLLNKNPKIIENYNLLQDIGIWEIIKSYEQELRTHEEVIELTQFLIENSSFVDVVNYIVDNLLNKFIPYSLLFIFEDECHRNEPNILYYKNLKATKSDIKMKSLEPYKYFFSLSPAPLTFGAFVYMIDDKHLTNIFQPLQPEIVIPFMQGTINYGFIIMGKKVLGSKYSNKELKYIRKIMNIISLALQNRIYYRRAISDLKTSLYVYNYFLERLNEELIRIKRYDSKISILLVDIDHFKQVNDTYGHMAGDTILFELAKLLKNNIRKEDIAARFGGEEFICMLIQCPVEAAWQVAERFRVMVEKNTFVYENKKIKITVSIGLSFASKKKYLNQEELVKQADEALYNSKKNGRNQSTICFEISNKSAKKCNSNIKPSD